MKASTMRTRITEVLGKLRKPARGAKPAVYSSEIIQSLEAMLGSLEAPQNRRAQMAGALERLVTEDYAFSESELGGEILRLTDDFASCLSFG